MVGGDESGFTNEGMVGEEGGGGIVIQSPRRRGSYEAASGPGNNGESFEENNDDDKENGSKSGVMRDVSRTSVVKFEGDDDGDAGLDDKETHFVRHNTPHPRELKTKAAKA